MRRRWSVIACLVTLAGGAVGCDPVGRGIVRDPVPEAQLRITRHPTHPIDWTPAFGPAASGDFRCVALADFDADKDRLPDLAAGGYDRRGVRVWLANGDGTWSSIEGPLYFGQPTGLAAGDIDRDGRNDLVIAGRGEVPGVRVWLNRLDTKEEWDEGEPATITRNYLAVKLRDLNGDGYPDILAAREKNGGNGGIAVWLSRDGKAWSADVGPKSDHTYGDLALGDFNRDGHLDIVAARWGNPGGLDIWYGNRLGSWDRAKEDPAHKLNYQGVDVGDFNGDGELDIVATSYRSDRSVCIFLNDRHQDFRHKDPRLKHRQAGWWSSPITLARQGSAWDAKAVDFNGDGLLDVASTSYDGRGVRLWLQLPRQESKGRFIVPTFMEQSRRLSHKGIYYAVDAADLNRDGKPELVATARDEGVKVWFQPDEHGGVKPSPHPRTGPAPGRATRPFGEEDEAPRDPPANRVYISLQRGKRTYTEYRIGVGDTLKIEVYTGRRAEPRLFIKPVEPAGTLTLPFVSLQPLEIVDEKDEGLSPSQLRDLITGKLANTLKTPVVTVNVAKYVARQAAILGEVRIKVNQSLTGPGQYILRGKTRVLEFIARHGGFTDRADLSKVEVRRRDGEKRIVDLFKAVFQSKLSQDIVLDDGDTITIPSIALSDQKVYVLGEVGRPGVYALRNKITLIEAIQLASSFTRRANRKQVVVVRGDKSRPELFQINVLQLLRTGDLSKNLLLENGDVVFVPRDWIGNLQEFYSWFLPTYRQIGG